MSADAKEAAFQQDIIDQMIEGGWKLGDPASYNPATLYPASCDQASCEPSQLQPSQLLHSQIPPSQLPPSQLQPSQLQTGKLPASLLQLSKPCGQQVRPDTRKAIKKILEPPGPNQ